MYRKRILARENVVTFIYYESIYKKCTAPQVTKLIEEGQSHKFKYFSSIFKSFKKRVYKMRDYFCPYSIN